MTRRLALRFTHASGVWALHRTVCIVFHARRNLQRISTSSSSHGRTKDWSINNPVSRVCTIAVTSNLTDTNVPTSISAFSFIDSRLPTTEAGGFISHPGLRRRRWREAGRWWMWPRVSFPQPDSLPRSDNHCTTVDCTDRNGFLAHVSVAQAVITGTLSQSHIHTTLSLS